MVCISSQVQYSKLLKMHVTNKRSGENLDLTTFELLLNFLLRNADIHFPCLDSKQGFCFHNSYVAVLLPHKREVLLELAQLKIDYVLKVRCSCN